MVDKVKLSNSLVPGRQALVGLPLSASLCPDHFRVFCAYRISIPYATPKTEFFLTKLLSSLMILRQLYFWPHPHPTPILPIKPWVLRSLYQPCQCPLCLPTKDTSLPSSAAIGKKKIYQISVTQFFRMSFYSTVWITFLSVPCKRSCAGTGLENLNLASAQHLL